MTVTDYPDWGTPQASANAIASTGAPLLALANQVTKQTGITLVPGVQQVYGPFPVTQISYEATLTIECNAADLNPFLAVELLWTNTVLDVNVSTERYYIGATSVAANSYRGLGQAKGNEVTVKVTWHGTQNTTDFQFYLAQTSRQYLRDDWRSSGTFNGITTYTTGVSDLDGDLLTSLNLTIPAMTGEGIALPLYTGYVAIYLQIPAANIESTILSIAQFAVVGGSSQLFFNESAGAINLNTTAVLGRGQCVLQLVNNTAAPVIVSGNIVVFEQDV